MEFKLPEDQKEERESRKQRFREALARTSPVLQLQKERAAKMLEESGARESAMKGFVDRRNELMERISTHRHGVKSEFATALARFRDRNREG